MRECGTARDADRQGAGFRGDEWSFPLISRHKASGENSHLSNLLVHGRKTGRLAVL